MKKNQSIFLPAVVAGVVSLLATGLASADNVFVSNNGNNTVELISASNSMPSTFISSGLNSPTGIAIYGNNIFVANNGSSVNQGYIEEYSLSTGLPVSTYATGLTGPRGITFDSAGNLYVADQGNGTVVKIPTGGGSLLTLASGLSAPNDVVLANGVLYATEGQANKIDIISGGGATPLVTGNGLNSPNGIAVDGGNLLVVSHDSGQVLTYSQGGAALGSSVMSIYLSSLDQPKAIAVDSLGNFYVTDNGDETVTEYSSTGVLEQVFGTDIKGNPAFSGSGYIVTDAVPEPTTYALMLVGLGLLIFMGRRKKAATASI